MTGSAGLLARLDDAVRRAVEAGEIGTARSIRLHVGAPRGDLPEVDSLLALGDAIFACGRTRVERLGTAILCVWENGQIATLSAAPSPRPSIVLAVLGSSGALHFRHGEK